MLIDTKRLINLNTSYVIVKTYKHTTYYNKDGYKRSSISPTSSYVYTTLEYAKEQLNYVNMGRKRSLYRIESAAHHFVNNFVLGMFGLENRIIEIKKIKENPNTKINSLDNLKIDVLQEYTNKLFSRSNRLDELITEIERIKQEIEDCHKLDFNEVLKDFVTSQDTTVKLLFTKEGT